MNIGLSQILFIIFICFLLFGNVANVFSNLKIFFEKFKDLLNTTK
jgi:hypothetical protein